MRKYCVFISLIFIHTVAQAQTQRRFRFVEITYGLFTIGPVTNNGVLSPSASNNVLAINAEYINKTDRIYVKPGNQFGVEYRLSGKPNDSVSVEAEWVFPEALIDPSKKIRTTSIRNTTNLPCNKTIASTYQLNNTFEMMKGKWYFNLYYQDKLIYTREFVLH